MTDTLIVGGGTAGCVLAARLSEDPAHTVRVLEAGPVWLEPQRWPAALRDAGRMPIDPAAPWLWRYTSTLDDGAGAAAAVVGQLVRGRVLGGSSSVNGSYFGRARAADFAAWSRIAGPLWDFDAVLPAYERSERDLDFGDRPGHGAHGPIPVRRTATGVPVSRLFADAVRAAGFGERADLNGLPDAGPSTGLAKVPCNVADGRRVGTAAAYLLPAATRPNLRVDGEVPVSRILLRRGRAVGVEYRRGRAAETAWADRIVLCAGAVESAALLLRSGIGPPGQLRALGITPVQAAPVGSWCTDHPEIGVEYRLEPEPDRPPTVPLEYVLDLDDIEIRPYTVSFTPDTYRLGVALMRPLAAGELRLRSADPARPPVLEHRYLSAAADRDRLRAAAVLATDLLAAVPGARASTVAPPAAGERAAAWLRARLATSQHLSGTCRMGGPEDPAAVVDAHCRVHGLAGLAVVDLSIVPVPLSRGPQASAVMLAERAAEFLRDGEF
ncbi:mycofactocin dehydrogenase MftG [Nocardia farcinica]|uniref:mycofactocin dehydrogenase MftG n=1 Tax=Nocardia farcinica TaxID=37329 RepID=UPI0024564A82|nr:mycofactocin system GMC family oxidoreductase MftG [Nocardia farcinica]